MSWFQEFFINLKDTIVLIFDTIYNYLISFYTYLSFLPSIFENVFSSLTYIPSFLLPFATLCMLISILFLVFGREHS